MPNLAWKSTTATRKSKESNSAKFQHAISCRLGIISPEMRKKKVFLERKKLFRYKSMRYLSTDLRNEFSRVRFAPSLIFKSIWKLSFFRHLFFCTPSKISPNLFICFVLIPTSETKFPAAMFLRSFLFFRCFSVGLHIVKWNCQSS